MMGFLQRLITLEDRIDPVRVALVGDGSEERKRMESAYLANPKTKLVLSGEPDDLEKFARTGNAELIEIFALPEKRAKIAGICLDAGVSVSVGMPPARDLEQIAALKNKAALRSKIFRVRNECLYYEPYQKAREIIGEEKIGWHTMLRLVVKRRQIPQTGFDRGKWILEKESDYMALAEYLSGPMEKVFIIAGQSKTNPGSILLGFKFKQAHRLGYMLVDFVPELQIRTFNEPVFRQVWATGTAGVLMINRGEGQLWRAPVLWLRAKDYSRTWEMLKDDWNSVYPAMVEETYNALRKNRPVVSGIELAESGVRSALAAGKSLEEGKEIAV
jgi:predicted dehydrogenase